MMKRMKFFDISCRIFGIVFAIATAFLFITLIPGEAVVSAEGAVKNTKSSDDTYSNTQWYVHNTGSYTDYSLGYAKKLNSTAGIDMNVINAWNSIKKNKTADREVVVAIIDTGVDYKHKDLAGHIWTNPGEIKGDHIDNDNNGYIDDYYGWDFYNDDASVCHYAKGKKTASPKDIDNHGTHIAGTIAAVADNNTGIAGIASDIDVKLMILKINGGKDKDGKISDAVEAVKYATMMGADICNMSWGTTEYSDDLYEAMKESDMLFVAAAGSDGTNNDKHPIYPANFKLDNLISVTSIDADGELPFFANFGSQTVDIAAPGEIICSTTVGGYGTMSGSSMAAPQVTAIAAMVYATGDHFYASNFKALLINHLKELPSLVGNVKYPGIPDAYSCISAAGEMQQDYVTPQLYLNTTYNKQYITVSAGVWDSGGSRTRVIKWIYGKRKIGDFNHGINGTSVEGYKVDLSIAGTYTFYISDYAGNETAVVYDVKDDTIAPELTATYKADKKYQSRFVTVIASDTQSGIKRVKYMAGRKQAKDFLPANAGEKITISGGKGTFTVKRDGTYTVFAVDNRGNMSVKVIVIKTIKAIGLDFVEQLVALTDGTSNEEKLAKVNMISKVNNLTEKTAIITAKAPCSVKKISRVTTYSDA